MDHINLLGAEDVRRASHNIQSAAETMMRAANQIDASLRDHKINEDERLHKLENLLERLEKLLDSSDRSVLDKPDSTFQEFMEKAHIDKGSEDFDKAMKKVAKEYIDKNKPKPDTENEHKRPKKK